MRPARFRLHHARNSRSARILWLLEEAGAAYELVRHDLSEGTQKRPDYLALNPAGKVPALEDLGPDGAWRDVVVTESAAICAYVADTLPEAALAPPIGTPGRAAYANWMAWCPGVLEPAFADLVFPRAAEAPRRSLGWPAYPEAEARLEAVLSAGGPWLLGDRFSAADILIGSMLQWLDAWGKLQSGEALRRYLGALEGRAALGRARIRDAEAETAAP
jgi:glutathione S-transferase